ncbi:myoD family inhibitor [Ascaphus truei]|uniref:myoD family inhibitor n=1 Tax=Ascaphus truei TaxID=8439 RepID=UPI003F5993B8
MSQDLPPPDPYAPGLDSEPVGSTQGQGAKPPNHKLPINGTLPETVVTEPPQITCFPALTPAVTKAPHAQNRIPHSPHTGDTCGHPLKSKSPKKTPAQPSLKKQGSRASDWSTETPDLPPGAREDCCVQCALALLFCQFLSLCNLFLDVLTCGSCSADSAGLCCSCCTAGGCPDCGDSCDTDCGIVDACCESADCLEICMECCGLCFSS